MSSKTTDNTQDVCPLCNEEIKYFAIGKCNHPVCFKCATRMRVLCQQNYCAICRAELQKMIYSSKPHRYDSFILHQLTAARKYNIYFETRAIQNTFYEIQEHKCPICKDRKPDRTFQQMRDHMRRDHGRQYCDLCVNHLTIFSSERKHYDRKDLATHRRLGDVDDKSYKGHPNCEFCDVRYFDNDELLKHLRKDHYFCHFCDTDGLQDYFENYKDLQDHFRGQHYLCEEDECRGVQFTNAFRSDIDLRAHKATEHTKAMKKAQARQARTLDIEFNYAPRESHRGRGRGVISREDYQEVINNAEKQLKQAQNRGHGKGRMDTELEAGIQASMADMEKKAKSRKSKRDSEEAGTQFKRTSADFPSLRDEDTATNSETDSQAPVQSKTSSMAQRFAMANNFSVAEGGLTQEEFPSLGGSSKSNSTIRKVPVKNQQAWINTKASLEEDFPALGPGDGAPSITKQMSKVKQRPSNAPTVIGNIALKNTQLKSSLPRPSSLKEISSLVAEEDFPSLGKSDPQIVLNTKWVKPVKEAEKEDEVPFMKVSTKKKKKKNKAAGTDCQKTSEEQKSHGKTEYTESSSSSLENKEPLEKKKKSSKKENKKEENDAAKEESGFDLYNLPFKKPSPPPPPEEKPLIVYKSVSKNPPQPQIQRNLDADFPSLLSTVQQPSKPPPGFSKGDSCATNFSRPPPGFNKTVANPPPGFTSPQVPKPPPGFSNPLNSVENISKQDKVTLSYIQPADFKQRNQKLMKLILDGLQDEVKFGKFKGWSGEFRKGLLQAGEYYRHCQDLFGEKQFDTIFPELVTLLPDVSKQNELLEVYNTAVDKKKSDVLQIRAKKKGWASGNAVLFTPCHICNQVLLKEDSEMHLAAHGLHTDFPSLGGIAASLSSAKK
ncbi:E3 ubiquitin-protein ligase ZNF598 [Lingula anatina]|uniref:RING-type E3 ubiquitin transferase n=1 Tax=Lingula anatina TaxID=7574 RepID=A0A1S3K4G5_LINAN|nr:E3 ubiquitin-protein ligase ZNF598 [Lingula anatina]|eukprot:XP_013417528.1 E3 ubiquitin-protein ligase ZNF598 [Lingula anatina]